MSREVPTHEELMHYTFRALAARALTEHELRARLRRRGADEAAAQRVLTRVRELGYLDDASLAKSMSARRGVGASRVRFDLARRGIDRHTIEDVLAERDPDEEREDIDRLVARHAGKWRRARDPRASAFGFLARRGFRPDQIFAALQGADLGPGRGASEHEAREGDALDSAQDDR